MIHGDDWKKGYDKSLRNNAIKALKACKGKLIEIPYTKGISSDALTKSQNLNLVTSDTRRGMLKRLLQAKNFLRFIEAHSPLSALISENALVKKNGRHIF